MVSTYPKKIKQWFGKGTAILRIQNSLRAWEKRVNKYSKQGHAFPVYRGKKLNRHACERVETFTGKETDYIKRLWKIYFRSPR